MHSLPTFIKRYPGRPKIPTAYPNCIIRMLLRGTSSLSRLFYCYLELRITEPSHPANHPIGKLVPRFIPSPFIALEGDGGHIKCSIDSPTLPPHFIYVYVYVYRAFFTSAIRPGKTRGINYPRSLCVIFGAKHYDPGIGR